MHDTTEGDDVSAAFWMVDWLFEEAAGLAETIVVDLHAEATSEKVARGHYLDGRITAVIGTHTHVQTSDARVLPGGTPCLTDVGMTRPLDSVTGVRTDIILQRFLTELPQQFELGDGPVRLNAALIGSDGGRATSIETLEAVLQRRLLLGLAGSGPCARSTPS